VCAVDRRPQELGPPSRFDLRFGDPLAIAACRSASFRAGGHPALGAGSFAGADGRQFRAERAPDMSSSNSWMALHHGPCCATPARARIAGPARLLFGSDSSFFPRGWQRGDHHAQRNPTVWASMPRLRRKCLR
jgi:hypothetical protein